MSARKYKYIGVDASAKRVSGVVDANSKQEALSKLKSLDIRPQKLMASGPKKPSGLDFEINLFGSSAKPKLPEFAAFCRQLATMQSSGIPILQALNILSEQAETPAFGKVLGTIHNKVQQGVSLTDALRAHTDVFDKIFINLVSAGELSGSLDTVLIRLATYYEKSAALRRKIISASTYPAVILVAVVVVLFVLLTFVVPTFAEMFASNGKALPGPTQTLLDISNTITENIYLVLFLIVGTFALLISLFTNEKMKKEFDPIILQIPAFGPLVKKVGVARFARTLSTMIQSGVPIVEALEITSKVSGNSVIENAIRKTKAAIISGNSIAGPLEKSKVFPKMVVSMIAIGEQTGTLDTLLMKIAEFYEDEVDNAVASLVSVLEPLMIIIVGLIIGSVLIPLYLPILSVADMV